MDALMNFGHGVFGGAWTAVWTLIKIILIVAPLMLGVAYLTLAERKLLALCKSVLVQTVLGRGV